MRGQKTGGRQKGTPNRVSATARDNIIRAFDGIGGIPALIEWAKANRTDFYRLYARLLPVESHVGGPDGGALEIPTLVIIGPPDDAPGLASTAPSGRRVNCADSGSVRRNLTASERAQVS